MNRFRSEAAPVPLEQLEGTEKQAFKTIVEWLDSLPGHRIFDEIACRDEELRRRHRDETCYDYPSPSPVSYDRRNQLLFMHGKRGTGKTSVLLTLMAELRSKGGSESKASISVCSALRNRVVWLDIRWCPSS